jgi:hypothetical protein
MSTPLDRTLTYRLHQLHKLTDSDSQSAYPEHTGLSMSYGFVDELRALSDDYRHLRAIYGKGASRQSQP